MRQDSPSHHRKHMIGDVLLARRCGDAADRPAVMPVALTAQSTQLTMSLVPTIK